MNSIKHRQWKSPLYLDALGWIDGDSRRSRVGLRKSDEQIHGRTTMQCFSDAKVGRTNNGFRAQHQ